jgi:hypothetical protein
MPDEQGKNPGDQEESQETQETPLHAYKDGREEDIEGSIPDGDKGTADVTPTGGATSGEESGTDPAAHGSEGRSADEEDEGEGDKGLGSETGGAGGAESPPTNADPSTQGATKGTEGPL